MVRSKHGRRSWLPERCIDAFQKLSDHVLRDKVAGFQAADGRFPLGAQSWCMRRSSASMRIAFCVMVRQWTLQRKGSGLVPHVFDLCTLAGISGIIGRTTIILTSLNPIILILNTPNPFYEICPDTSGLLRGILLTMGGRTSTIQFVGYLEPNTCGASSSKSPLAQGQHGGSSFQNHPLPPPKMPQIQGPHKFILGTLLVIQLRETLILPLETRKASGSELGRYTSYPNRYHVGHSEVTLERFF